MKIAVTGKGGVGKHGIAAQLCLQDVNAVENLVHGIGHVLQNDPVLTAGIRHGLPGRSLGQKMKENGHGQGEDDHEKRHALGDDAVSEGMNPDFPFVRHVTILL